MYVYSPIQYIPKYFQKKILSSSFTLIPSSISLYNFIFLTYHQEAIDTSFQVFIWPK